MRTWREVITFASLKFRLTLPPAVQNHCSGAVLFNQQGFRGTPGPRVPQNM